MSYDLYFTSPEISREQFRSYFSQRPRYQLNGDQAWYSNEDTGVYFSFDYDDPDKSENDSDEEFPSCSVSFNLNFYRPHYFALEAEPEVTAFVRNFRFEIHDPQNSGMAEGPYTSEGFFAGWNAGNAFGYRAVLSKDENPDAIHHRSTSELEAFWRWNFSRDRIYESLGVDIFVPRIMFVVNEGALRSLVVWPDAIPTLIPEVDLLYVPRKELAPKRFFKRTEDECILFRKDAEGILPPSSEDFPVRASRPGYETPPADVVNFVKKLAPCQPAFEAIAMDSVLNSELIREAMEGG
ncbi:MAG: hypothetical protein AAF591_19220 [Verrucomicrobiota bacterium]